MKNSTRRIISMILAVCICMSVLSTLVVPVEAASNIVINGVDIGYANGSYFTKNGATCKDNNNYHNDGTAKATCHNRRGYDCAKTTDPSCNCLRYWPTGSASSCQVDLKASQCFGFARYCQWKVYGTFDINSASSFTDLTGDVYESDCTGSNLKQKLINCAPATHVRTRTTKKGWGHSISIISTSDYGVNFADCNSDGCCKVRSVTMSWDELATYMKSYGGIDYANSYKNAAPTHPTHTYTGSYHDAAHPHKVYQKCSCGATQYTGATTTVSSCATCNPVNTTSKYNAVLPFKAYLKGTADIVPYSDKQMTSPKGEIWTTDECTITAVYSNGACEVKYLAGTETKIAYTPLSNFVGNTSASLAQQTVNRQVKTYIRSSTGSTQYGHTDPGDVIYKLGTSGSMTQIFYPTGSGYKLAWVVTGELVEPTYDNRFNPYCPIKGFPCATATFDVYESDHTTYKGKIFTTDYCTINAVYADGWCQVTYPTSSGDKTGYITLDKFVYNVNATHVKYTANAQIKVHKNSSLPGDMNWYISSGDQFFVVGSSGSSSQVLYPIDAQYGGGYKLGWISTSNIPKTTYTVSYNANGGSGAPGNQTKTHGVTLTLSSTKPTRSGYTFVGWATSASATSASYMPGASYTNDANLTLYAVWKLNKYEISYNANGGSGAPAAQSKTHGTNLTLSSTVPKKYYTVTFNANGGSVDVANRQVACTFKGWATSSTATSAAYQPGGTFTANANTTLYAVWQNASLGSYPMPVRSGYVFDGWYTAASGGSQVTNSTTISGNMTIYAHWTIATYEVNYDANGGTGAPASQTKTHGKNLTLSSTVPTRENYFFCGWGTEEAPDSVQYQPGSTYTTNSDIMLIAVWEKVALERIEIVTYPDKIDYFKGDMLDTTGLTLRATYNDGTTKTIASGFACSPTSLNTAGTQTITVSYGGKTTTFTVTVNAVTLTKIEVASKPSKTSYYVGEKLNTAGLTLKATYNNGSTQTISSGFSCSPMDLNTAGTQTITVSYSGKTTTFTVTVNAVTLSKIEVASKPSKTSYYVGERLDTAGLTLKATYNNGSTQTISSGFSCSPMDLNTAGTQTITVSYSGKTTTFNVTVNDVVLNSISVATMPVKTDYYVGDWLDTTGLTVKAIYNNGTTETITSGFTCSPLILNTAGAQPITVSYGGKTTSFDVNVYDMVLVGLDVATEPVKTEYYVGETLDTTGLTLTAFYSNGTTKTIRSDFTCSPTKLNTVGTQTITVSYGNKSTTFTVEVNELPNGRISVSKVTGAPGETVQVAISLDSNPGIITARLQIAYDSDVLTLTDVKDGGILGEHVFGGNLSANPYTVFWENGLAESEYTATGTLVWLTFKIAENAPAGEFPVTVSYDPEEIYNMDLVNVAFTVSQGSVTVKKNDPDAPQIIAENKTASCGTTVTLDVQIANNPGFSVLNVAFLYDTEYLTLRGIENHLATMTMTQGASVVWDAAENYTENGVLCTLTFEIAENAPEGAYEIQVLFISASNSDFEEVTMEGVSGILEVRDILYGDVNGDGKIASVDLAMLRKHIASVDPITGVSTVAVKAGADCNGDGKINSVDLAMLRRYLASIDPITGESPIILGPK